jgi:uncharacterized protein YpuA (DUF1002 family)
MKKLLLVLIILIAFLGSVYGASTSGFAITYGETTYNNPSYKSTVNTYFQSHTDKNLSTFNTTVVTASQVNQIAKNITGRTYNSNQIFSCALVDLSYSQGIKIIVDSSKINTVTSKMYANALKSTGITNGYVVVTSPVNATGESALTGVLESYEVAVGTSIPEEAKKAATEELYTETQIANQTNQSTDKIAELFDQAQQEVQKQNLQDPTQIKTIVNNVANSTNINLTDNQTQDIANALANSQKVQGNLTDFKNQLQAVTQQASQSQGILNQIKNYLQSFVDYITSFFG